jgi:hypothetical protein
MAELPFMLNMSLLTQLILLLKRLLVLYLPGILDFMSFVMWL